MNTTITARVAADVRSSLETAARLKGWTLSKYVDHVLTTHVVDLGMLSPASIGPVRHNALPDSKYVRAQVLADLQREYEAFIERGVDPRQARANTEAMVAMYASRGVSISFDDLGVE